jgi:hypothetical protein
MDNIAPLLSSAARLLAILVKGGTHPQIRFREFFGANIRNRHMRRAYAQAVREFLVWCKRAHVASITDMQRSHVAAYVDVARRVG